MGLRSKVACYSNWANQVPPNSLLGTKCDYSSFPWEPTTFSSSQFCSNTCFWKLEFVPVDIVGNNLTITQILCLLYTQFCSSETHRKLYPAQLNHVGRHKAHTSDIYQLTLVWAATIHSYVVSQFPIWFQITLLFTLHVEKKRWITFKRYCIFRLLLSQIFSQICCFELSNREVQTFSCQLILRLFHRKLNRTYLSLEGE